MLITALKAYGFDPVEEGQDGIAGMPGIRGISGDFALKVPDEQAKDAKILCDELLKQMIS